jgi:hypothetical protein
MEASSQVAEASFFVSPSPFYLEFLFLPFSFFYLLLVDSCRSNQLSLDREFVAVVVVSVSTSCNNVMNLY